MGMDTGIDTGTDTGAETGTGMMDSGGDTLVADTGPDVVTTEEGGTDAGPDGDAGCTAPNAQAVAWPARLSQAVCQHFASCCFPANPGMFNLAQCEADNAGYGWENSVPTSQSEFNTCNAMGAPSITIDPSQAINCLNAISSLPCAVVSAAQYGGVTAACNQGVLSGTVPIGQGGCTSAFQCVPGAYCDTRVDGGVCSALVGAGQSCTQAPVDQACSYLGLGPQAYYCNTITDAGSAGYGTCQPRKMDTASCIDSQFTTYDQACQSLLCNNTGSCGGSVQLPATFICTQYTLDAGADGG
jgi:hypothetical protein